MRLLIVHNQETKDRTLILPISGDMEVQFHQIQRGEGRSQYKKHVCLRDMGYIR
jgi:hypothetical protein